MTTDVDMEASQSSTKDSKPSSPKSPSTCKAAEALEAADPTDVLLVGVMVLLWWSTTAFFGVAAKQLMSAAPGYQAVLVFTWCQVILAALLYCVSCLWRTPSLPLMELCDRNMAVGLLHLVANLGTNVVLAQASLAMTYTYKALEPLFVLLALRVITPERFTEVSTF